ncbi:hypothetical protein J2X36_002116 [Methylobacterium sp. BE186]|uniref:hypothetical protein n=1 Tax=Methylobacterium sp. BE186 TaxID=2817715 RepID=UPI0028598E9F|nr:hypothetical protein [Methylobacterium sp. BE186]MDR7037369.1 hypothetical protein [Methylobacterium sp. BE186]
MRQQDLPPYRIPSDGRRAIVTEGGLTVATFTRHAGGTDMRSAEDAEAVGAFLVRASNAHRDLCRALSNCRAQLALVSQLLASSDKKPSGELHAETIAILETSQAAIAKAEQQP